MHIKMIKFNLPLDGYACRTKEDISDNFNLPELIDHFKSGRLLLWCKVRQMREEVSALEEIQNEDTLTIAQKLCEVFDIKDEYIASAVMVYEYINKNMSEKYNRTEQERIKHIFEKYAQNYAKEYTEANKDREKKKEEDRQLFSIDKIKCISATTSDLKRGILSNCELIYLYANYLDGPNKIRNLSFVTGDKKKAISTTLYRYGVHSTMNGYHLIDLKGLQLIGDTNKIDELFIYVYDIHNEIPQEFLCTTPESEEIINHISSWIDSKKLIKSMSNE